MRISAEDLNDVIPRFMRDGWQVVSTTESTYYRVSEALSFSRRMYTLLETEPME